MTDTFILASPLTGWVTRLDDVPDPVFAERMLGDGVAIDPTGDTLFAPCEGEVLTVNEARHALSLRSDAGAEIILHLGIDTVALGGEAMEALVRPGDRVATGDPLLKFDLDLLVQRAAAVVTPIVVCQPECFAVEVMADGMVSAGQPLIRVRTKGAERDRPGAERAVMTRTVEVALEHGIHARPAARIAEAVRDLDAAALLIHRDKKASASSPVAILGLGAGHGALITVEASGLDAKAALDAVEAALRAGAQAPQSAGAAIGDGALVGVAAAPGVAVGRAFWLRPRAIELDQAQETPEREQAKLASALSQVEAQMSHAAGASGSSGEIIRAQLALLEDPAIRNSAFAAIATGTGAAAAWQSVLESHAGALASSDDARIAERAEDLRDIEGRVLAALLGASAAEAQIPEGSILLAEEILPSQLLMLDQTKIAGIALVRGGPTSHAAILAAGIGVPMAVAFGAMLEQVEPGSDLLLDGSTGRIELDPPEERVREGAAVAARRVAPRTHSSSHDDGLCRTRDGTRVDVFANVGSIAEARAAVEQGAEGCGLLRTEFLFLDRNTPPTEAEQTAAYQAIADTFGGRPFIVRLLDLGGDKPAPYLDLGEEENPALGMRGIRAGLARAELLETQIKAILSVTPPGRCKIMAPMVASLAELEAVAAIIERLGGGAELGVMIETPAAAVTADLLARQAAFLSIGSNDLTQYTLAMDRGNAALAAGLDALHPAVLRLIGRTCDDAEKHDTPVAVCGALAADPLAVPLLIGLGVSELSVPPGRVAATRAAVAELSLPSCRALASEALGLTSAAAIRTFAAACERSPR